MGECVPAMTVLKSNAVPQVIQTAVFTRDQLNIMTLLDNRATGKSI